jgi:hypothetical protein
MRLQSPLQHPFARSLVTVRTWPFFIDVGIAACLLAIFFAIVTPASIGWVRRSLSCPSRTP